MLHLGACHSNYESEGAIGWSEPRECRDPWGGMNRDGGGIANQFAQLNQQLYDDLKQKAHNALYKMMQRDRMQLPIWNMQREIVQSIEKNPVVLVS